MDPSLWSLPPGVLGPSGVLVLLLVILLTYLRGWWYSGRDVTRMTGDCAARIASAELERDKARANEEWWRDKLLAALGAAETLSKEPTP